MKLEKKIRKDFDYNFENFEGLDALKRAVIITIRKHKAKKKALKVTQDRSIRIIKQVSKFVDEVRKLHKETVLHKFPKGGVSSECEVRDGKYIYGTTANTGKMDKDCEHRNLERIDVIGRVGKWKDFYYRCKNESCLQKIY